MDDVSDPGHRSDTTGHSCFDLGHPLLTMREIMFHPSEDILDHWLAMTGQQPPDSG